MKNLIISIGCFFLATLLFTGCGKKQTEEEVQKLKTTLKEVIVPIDNTSFNANLYCKINIYKSDDLYYKINPQNWNYLTENQIVNKYSDIILNIKNCKIINDKDYFLNEL